MTRLLLALWASLASSRLAGVWAVPGKGSAETAPAPSPLHPTPLPTARNLSCFECFRVPTMSECRPTECGATERVCISNQLVFFTKTNSKTLLSKRCAYQCPNSNSMFEWSVGQGIQAKIIRRCCYQNLCNTAPATQRRPGALLGALLLPTGLVVLHALC